MTTATLGILLGMAVTGLFVALGTIGRLQRDLERQRIRIEELSAWTDEYQRERDALASEVDRLQAAQRTLQELYTRRTREALAANYQLIAVNVARRGGWQ